MEETPDHELLWEVDGYLLKTKEKDLWTLHIVCPKCGNNLSIKSMVKDIQVDERGVQTEEFRCTWPGEFTDGGACEFRGALDLPPKDKRITRDNHGVRRIVDAVIKRA